MSSSFVYCPLLLFFLAISITSILRLYYAALGNYTILEAASCGIALVAMYYNDILLAKFKDMLWPFAFTIIKKIQWPFALFLSSAGTCHAIAVLKPDS